MAGTLASKGKGQGKVKGEGKKAPVARRNRGTHQKPVIEGITKGDVRRLARKGGVRRIELGVYDYSRAVLKDFVAVLVKNALVYSGACNRKTVTGMDVVMAMKRQGVSLYGAV